ncbi:MAG: DUF3703 domain-containing protein [Pseudomonadota bacterium]
MSLRADQRRAWRDEMSAARSAEAAGDLATAFGHLERAHIIGQRDIAAHALAHVGMLRIGLRRADAREILGQLLRIPAALTKTPFWVPPGNTGGANVSAFRPMPVPDDLKRYVA